ENDTSNLTLNYTTYGSVDTDDYSSWSIFYTQIVFAGVCLGVSVCGLVGNGMVLWFLSFHMKQNPFTVYILNLAVADFSLSLLIFLLYVALLIFATLCAPSHFVFVFEELFFVLGFLYHLFNLSSLGLLTALSLEHCVSVL
ncbi:MAS protein, partial [Serilophus lunatus]|nr:MAS protein [Serilophus lunatus]